MKKIAVVALALLLISCKDQNENTKINFTNDDFMEVTLPDENQVIEDENQMNEEKSEQVDFENTTEIEAPLVEVEEVIIDPMEKNKDNLSKEDIMWLQESLKIAGYYTKRDGAYGQDTQNKLESFQKDNQLSVGIYDEMTKELLVDLRIQNEAPGLGGNLVLINKNFYLPSDFVPSTLREVEVAKNKSIELPDHVATITEKMFADALADGIELILASGYRSYDYQEGLFNTRVSNYGFNEAEKVVAIPGESEHQTGLAIDITCAAMDYGLSQSFDTTEAYAWLNKHAYEYGFILRYAEDKTEITGYIYEPWHYRYIGDSNLAKDLMDSGETLDEYLSK
ncbi:MAG: D-alanyl-D-alanine carboxypeptidase family protein [Clostridia bacterium]|nr:D-alanyl-D-alanine carboxypeptidase family protein [Clostridia bacterium]